MSSVTAQVAVAETLKKPFEMMRTALKNLEDSRLNAFFRCDHGNCGARAVVETTLHSGNVLYWCNHHAREVEEAITPYVKHWYTEEILLSNNRLKGSANS